jgi:hypothetical protein
MIEYHFGLVPRALFQSLTDAEDYVEAAGEGKAYLMIDECV